jgi:siroheme synthase-like protein
MKRAAAHYPVFLDLAGKHCLVVGGGSVSRRKARELVRSGARVTVVAPEVRGAFPKRARVLRRTFRPGDLAGKTRPWLAVAATDDRAVNRRVSELCLRRGVWCNVVDDPALCGFIAPAVARRGVLTFAVSTRGASPALAGFAARRLKTLFGPEYAALARRLGRLRPLLRRIPMKRRGRFLRTLLTHGGIQRLPKEPARLKRRILREIAH